MRQIILTILWVDSLVCHVQRRDTKNGTISLLIMNCETQNDEILLNFLTKGGYKINHKVLSSVQS